MISSFIKDSIIVILNLIGYCILIYPFFILFQNIKIPNKLASYLKNKIN